MNISGMSDKTASAYLQFLTGSKTASSSFTAQTQSSDFSTKTLSTPYLDKALEGNADLTVSEQAAARAELKAVIQSRLFSIKVDV